MYNCKEAQIKILKDQEKTMKNKLKKQKEINKKLKNNNSIMLKGGGGNSNRSDGRFLISNFNNETSLTSSNEEISDDNTNSKLKQGNQNYYNFKDTVL